MSIFSDRLKWLREKNGLTQKEMGDKLGLSGPSYSKYEYGLREPNIDTLAKLPEILKESLDFLLGVKNLTSISQFHYTDLVTKMRVYKERETEVFKIKFDPEYLEDKIKEKFKPLGNEYIEKYINALDEMNLKDKTEIQTLCPKIHFILKEIPHVDEKYLLHVEEIQKEVN